MIQYFESDEEGDRQGAASTAVRKYISPMRQVSVGPNPLQGRLPGQGSSKGRPGHHEKKPVAGSKVISDVTRD